MKWYCFRPPLCTLLRLNWAKQVQGDNEIKLIMKHALKSLSLNQRPSDHKCSKLCPPICASKCHLQKMTQSCMTARLSSYMYNFNHRITFVFNMYYQTQVTILMFQPASTRFKKSIVLYAKSSVTYIMYTHTQAAKICCCMCTFASGWFKSWKDNAFMFDKV